MTYSGHRVLFSSAMGLPRLNDPR